MREMMFNSGVFLTPLPVTDQCMGGLIGVGLLLAMLGGAYTYVFGGKLPRSFWLAVGGIMFGPCLISILFQSWAQALSETFGETIGWIVFTLILLGLAAGAFLYVRAKILHRLNQHRRNDATNEREPIFPAHHDEDEE